MIQSLLRMLIKVSISFVIWVFVLSIRFDGQTLFDRAHYFLVENQLVSDLEDQINRVVNEALELAKSMIHRDSEEEI